MVSLSLSCLSLYLLKRYLTFELRIPLPKIHVVWPKTLLKKQIQNTKDLQLTSYMFRTKLHVMSLSHRGRIEHMKQHTRLDFRRSLSLSLMPGLLSPRSSGEERGLISQTAAGNRPIFNLKQLTSVRGSGE